MRKTSHQSVKKWLKTKRVRNLQKWSALVELIEEHSDDRWITTYRQGEYVDLAVGHTSINWSHPNLPPFNVAGCLLAWSEQRDDTADLWYCPIWQERLKTISMREKLERDHRKLGKGESLHDFSEVGQGLPFWLPNGATIRRGGTLHRYLISSRLTRLHSAIASVELYKLRVTGITTVKTCSTMDMGDGEEICILRQWLPSPLGDLAPCAFLLRELPIRITEIGMPWRKFGALTGLQRVRWNVSEWYHTFGSDKSRIQEDPSIDHRCVYEPTWRIFACLIVILKINTNTLMTTVWKCSTHVSHVDDMGVEYYEAEEAAFWTKNWISSENGSW